MLALMREEGANKNVCLYVNEAALAEHPENYYLLPIRAGEIKSDRSRKETFHCVLTFKNNISFQPNICITIYIFNFI